jgi:hypothetical protein
MAGDRTANEAIHSLEGTHTEREAVDPTTVYYLHNKAHQLLYVGISTSALGLDRFGRHARDKDWWPEVAYISLEHMPTRAYAAHREAAAIEHMKPKHNRQGGAISTQRVRERPSECSHDGCERLPTSKGMCDKHYMRYWRRRASDAA